MFELTKIYETRGVVRCLAQEASLERCESPLQCVFLPASCTGSPDVQHLSVVTYAEVGLSENADPGIVYAFVSDPSKLIYLAS